MTDKISELTSTIADNYHRFYDLSQRYHFGKDEPAGNTGLVINNNEYHATTHS